MLSPKSSQIEALSLLPTLKHPPTMRPHHLAGFFLLPFLAHAQKTETVTIPGAEQTFKIAFLPGGTFTMGSQPSEPGRDDDEGQHTVTLDSFWIGIHEVTWDEYYLFQFVQKDNDSVAETFKADAIARPSPPYFDFTYGRGREGGYPATTMTQQAALRYCQWLSDKTGHFYRLPTEAEWESACRAGSSGAYSWGDDPAKADSYAWFGDNSNGTYQKVGLKKPNAWGLYDMHGNAAEWTADFYAADYFARLDTASINPTIVPLKKNSRTVRGGSFEDKPEDLRCAERFKSDPVWQRRDPQIPKSKWWNPDSPFLGFRIVRDGRNLDKAERDAYFATMIKD